MKSSFISSSFNFEAFIFVAYLKKSVFNLVTLYFQALGNFNQTNLTILSTKKQKTGSAND